MGGGEEKLIYKYIVKRHNTCAQYYLILLSLALCLDVQMFANIVNIDLHVGKKTSIWVVCVPNNVQQFLFAYGVIFRGDSLSRSHVFTHSLTHLLSQRLSPVQNK